MTDPRPGLNSSRLIRLMKRGIASCQLDLSGKVVLTEAATGAYVVTPILAAMAGARKVFAYTRTTRYGSLEDVKALTHQLAKEAHVSDCVEVIGEIDPKILASIDILTNSGHLRPIQAQSIRSLKPGAVIPLMYEKWEFRDGDLDLQACKERGIQVVATNERHPTIDVFSDLGPMAAKLLFDAGVEVRGSAIALLCDNPFQSYIHSYLERAGASVKLVESASQASGDTDALLVAMKPRQAHAAPILSQTDILHLSKKAPGSVVVQFWGDLDRAALDTQGIPTWPATTPKSGHMGILPSGIGPDPIVRLQAGGLKAAEVALKPRRTAQEEEYFVPL